MCELHFRKELFLASYDYEESLTLDRKVGIYGLSNKCGLSDKKKKDFIVDFIALANTAVIYRRPAYLLLGINDDGDIIGLKDEMKDFGYTDSVPLDRIRQQVERCFAQVIQEYIFPDPKWELSIERLPDNNGYLVPVIQVGICPFATQRYHVSKKICHYERDKTGNKIAKCYYRGDSWRRHGESNAKIESVKLVENEWEELIARPQIFPSQWLGYFSALLQDNDLRQVPPPEQYIDDLRVSSGARIADFFQEFLKRDDQQLFVLEGVAGSGKSVFAKHIVLTLAQAGRDDVEKIINEGKFSAPEVWTPLYFALKQREIKDHTDLTQQLIEEVNGMARFWDDEAPEKPESLFKHRSSDSFLNVNWIIFLDGLDEILDDRAQRQFLRALKRFMNHFPNVKIALFTRPFIISNDWKGWSRTVSERLQHLTEDQIRNFIQAALLASTQAEYVDTLSQDIESFFRHHDDLWKLCSTPYYLANAITVLGLGELELPEDAIPTIVFSVTEPQHDRDIELPDIHEDDPAIVQNIPEVAIDELILEEPVEKQDVKSLDEENDDNFVIPIRLGDVLDNLYSALWIRESKRHNIHEEESSEWKDRTARFAAERCKKQVKSPRFLRETALKALGIKKLFYWLLSVGIFDKTQRGTYQFFTNLTQYYFAALWIQQLLDVGEDDAANDFLANCKTIEALSLI